MFEKKRGKRFLASVMALVMLLSLAPVGALAAENEDQQENPAVTLPADEVDPKPVVTDEENTENTNEELTPPPCNEGDTVTPVDNNDTSTAISETLVILNPVDLLNQASDYTTELTWSQSSSSIKDATFFYLKTPTSKLNSNKPEDWGPALGNGTINTEGLIWVDSSVWGSGTYVENATNVTNSNVKSWPSTHGEYGSEKGGYVLNESSTHWETIFDAYKDSIKNQLKIENLQKSDVKAIILTPFKVSRYNVITGKTEKSYHVDCKVEVKCTQVVTATFNVKDVNDDDYVQVKAENYKSGSQVNFPSYSPEKAGYKFSGWYFDRNLSEKVEENYTIGNENVDFYAKYTPKTYTVTWVNYDGTVLETDGNVEYNSTPHYNGATPERAAETGHTYEFKGWTPEISPVTGDVTYTAEYTATKDLTYTIIQNFIDGKGNPIEAMKKETPKTIAAEDAVKVTDLNTMIPEDMQQDFTDSASNKYMYVPTKTEFSTTTLVNGTKINLYYYLDNWKDGSSVEEDNDKGGDGIPDCDQVLIKYVSSNSERGTVSPDMEVLTLRKDNENVQIKINGSKATDNGGRNYFSNWTEDNTQVSTNATLNHQTILDVIKEFTGGKTYTFTANFGYSSGGGSGGSNRPKPPVVEIPDDVPTGLNGKDHYAYIIGYGNNDVRPQNNITRAEVATIFFRLLTDETRTANMTKSNGYNDVKDGDWFCCAVSTLSKMGIIKGYEDGSFKPNDPISRAEFAAIAARFDPDGDKTPATFADVTSHWAKDEISIAANHGWIKGYEDGSFKPDQKITRAETMTLVNRVLNRLPETQDDLHKDMKTWVDNMDETAWYYLAVQEATNSHYFKNKTSTKFEQWTDLRDTRDWSELEK